MKVSEYTLEFAVFVCGAVVMIFELVGSRVLAPHFGTSMFVWTGLIGIILGSLSLGYYLGGKLADRSPSLKTLSLLILLSAVFMGSTIVIKELLLLLLNQMFGLRVGSLVGSTLLFLPSSFLLGMVTPYAAKLKLVDIENSGKTIGNLYALSTVGSIIGTFAAGFWLIPTFGTNLLLAILSLLLVTVSILVASSHLLKHKISAGIAILLFGILAFYGPRMVYAGVGFVDTDTQYNRIWIYDYKDEKTGKMAKVMSINGDSHSAMFLDGQGSVFEYTEFYHLARHFRPGFKDTLMLGGAGYSFPKEFLKTYPEARMDVAEIDPGVTDLAKKYFDLKQDSRLAIYHEDARVFLNQTDKKYDVIFGDAFSSHYSVPYQLTTQEAVRRQYDLLNEGGVVILNLISAIEGDRGQFLRAEYATYRQAFPQVLVLPVNEPKDGQRLQNIMMVALKSRTPPRSTSDDPEIDRMLDHIWSSNIPDDVPILTDDHAPVDYYLNQAF